MEATFEMGSHKRMPMSIYEVHIGFLEEASAWRGRGWFL